MDNITGQLAEKIIVSPMSTIATAIEYGAALITAHDAEVRAELLAPGPCGKHPKMSMRWKQAEGELGLDPMNDEFICTLCLELDKVRAETLARAAALMDTHIDYPCDREEEISNSIFSYARNEILALSPDPHWRERIELEARIAEADIWDSATTTSEHWNYKRSARKQWRDEHISILKFKLAALDAQSVANLPIDRGYCGRCGNSIPECKCVADAPKGEVK